MSSYGLYLAASGAAAHTKQLEVLSNNMSNVNTVGFKPQFGILMAQPSEAILQGEDYLGSESINDTSGGLFLHETVTDFSPKGIRMTGNPTDLAILGPGFFEVQTEDGQTALTRAGNFMINANNQLVTQQNYPVLSEDKTPITIDPAGGPIHVATDGFIRQGNIELGKLQIVNTDSPADLRREGENLFIPLAPTLPVENATIQSGKLELSGINPTEQMLGIIETTRAVEANVKMIQNQDQLMGDLISRVLR
ncbi:MAG: flagellar hook basal-body protein [Pirellulaceae bacterium]|nr:flagellar hook basal-body protein [Pirellulaceae bacterium]